MANDTRKNAVFAAAQPIGSGICFFLNYALIWQNLGTRELGLWSVIASVTNLGNMAYFGFSAGVVNFAAKYHALGDEDSLNALVRNNLIAVAGLSVGLGGVIYGVMPYVYTDVIESVDRRYFAELLLLNLTGLVLTSVSTSFAAVLEGAQRAYLRSILQLAGALFNLVACTVLIPVLGLYGAAWANLCSGSFLLISGYLVARRILPGLCVWPLRWSTHQYRQTAHFNAGAQGVAVLQLLLDPLTKYLLGSFVSLTFIAYFELANKLVIQARLVVVMGLQVIAARVAAIADTPDGFVREKHSQLMVLLTIGAGLGLGYALIVAQLVGHVWPAAAGATFAFCLTVLATAWSVNLLSMPAYLLFWGTRQLRYALVSQALLIGFTGVLAWGLGYWFGGQGIVLGVGIAVTLSSGYVLVQFSQRYGISKPERSPMLRVFGAVAVTGVLAYETSRWLAPDSMGTATGLALGLLTTHTLLVYLVLSGRYVRSLWPLLFSRSHA